MKSMIESLDRLYRSIEFPHNTLSKYEIAILQGVKNDIVWDKLTDEQKLEFRKGDLVHKVKVSYQHRSNKY